MEQTPEDRYQIKLQNDTSRHLLFVCLQNVVYAWAEQVWLAKLLGCQLHV